MLTILSTILGFAGPFIPELLKFFRQKSEMQHELEVMRLQADIADRQHQWKIEEINVHADVAESLAIRKPVPSFGVQILDAAKGLGISAWTWIPVFWMFALLDWLSGMVRPLITYAVVAFWLAFKIAAFMNVQELEGWRTAIQTSWQEDDLAVLMLVLSYWFGQRAMKAAFGGSASTGKPGAG